jgi:hypothetical protein
MSPDSEFRAGVKLAYEKKMASMREIDEMEVMGAFNSAEAKEQRAAADLCFDVAKRDLKKVLEGSQAGVVGKQSGGQSLQHQSGGDGGGVEGGGQGGGGDSSAAIVVDEAVPANPREKRQLEIKEVGPGTPFGLGGFRVGHAYALTVMSHPLFSGLQEHRREEGQCAAREADGQGAGAVPSEQEEWP